MTSPHNEKAKAGFTLVELLATIAIMAVLAALSVLGVQKAINSAGQAGNASNLRALAAASMAYASDHNGWLPEATYFGNHIPQRMWPLVSLLQGKYVDQSSLSSPLALPVASAGGGSNQGACDGVRVYVRWRPDHKLEGRHQDVPQNRGL